MMIYMYSIEYFVISTREKVALFVGLGILTLWKQNKNT